MSTQKKSLLGTLKIAKKAQVASGNAKGTKGVKMAKAAAIRMAKAGSIRAARFNRLKLASNHNQTLLS